MTKPPDTSSAIMPRRTPQPQNGPHIAQIELLTPYAQIVDLSRRKAAEGYSEAQANQDYDLHGKTIRVNIVITLPAAYPKTLRLDEPGYSPPATGTQKKAMTPENFWQNFQFQLKQNGKPISSRSINNCSLSILPPRTTLHRCSTAKMSGSESDAKRRCLGPGHS